MDIKEPLFHKIVTHNGLSKSRRTFATECSLDFLCWGNPIQILCLKYEKFYPLAHICVLHPGFGLLICVHLGLGLACFPALQLSFSVSHLLCQPPCPCPTYVSLRWGTLSKYEKPTFVSCTWALACFLALQLSFSVSHLLLENPCPCPTYPECPCWESPNPHLAEKWSHPVLRQWNYRQSHGAADCRRGRPGDSRAGRASAGWAWKSLAEAAGDRLNAPLAGHDGIHHLGAPLQAREHCHFLKTLFGTLPSNHSPASYLIFVISFTQPHFEVWKIYTQKGVNLQQELPRDKTA